MCRISPLLCADAGCERWCKQLSPGASNSGHDLFFGKDAVKHNRLLCGFNGFLICPPLLGEVLIRVLVVNLCLSYVCCKVSVVFYRGQPSLLAFHVLEPCPSMAKSKQPRVRFFQILMMETFCMSIVRSFQNWRICLLNKDYIAWDYKKPLSLKQALFPWLYLAAWLVLANQL